MSSEDDLMLILAAASVLLITQMLTDTERKENKKKKRRLWTQKFLQRRQKGLGVTNILTNEFRMEDSESCKMFLRLCREHFSELLHVVKSDISKHPTNMQQCVTAEQRLAITLRFLATGESYRSLMFATKVHESTISVFIPQVCKIIYNKLQVKYLKVPKNADDWKQIADNFEKKCNFPLCLGALDGRYINFKSSSVVFLALADANYKFIYVDVGVYENISDDDIYEECRLKEAIDTNVISFPADVSLPGQTVTTPYTFVTDNTFPLSDRTMKPYCTGELTNEKQIYNHRLSSVNQVGEDSFRILTNRFRILSTTINLCLDKVQDITLACCALHNFLITKNPTRYTKVGQNISVLRRLNQCESENILTDNALTVRDAFCEYVNTNGVVPCQNN